MIITIAIIAFVIFGIFLRIGEVSDSPYPELQQPKNIYYDDLYQKLHD